MWNPPKHTQKNHRTIVRNVYRQWSELIFCIPMCLLACFMLTMSIYGVCNVQKTQHNRTPFSFRDMWTFLSTIFSPLSIWIWLMWPKYCFCIHTSPQLPLNVNMLLLKHSDDVRLRGQVCGQVNRVKKLISLFCIFSMSKLCNVCMHIIIIEEVGWIDSGRHKGCLK